MKRLSVDQIEEARIKLLANAKSLFSEAELLFDHGFFARSYTLAHICCEELAKIPMLAGAGLDLENGDEVDWGKLAKRLTSHVEKIKAVHAHDYFRSEIRADDADLKQYEQALTTTSHLNNMKNNSLYAGQVDSNFLSPSEVISIEATEELLAITRDRLAYIQRGEELTQGKISGSRIAKKMRCIAKE